MTTEDEMRQALFGDVKRPDDLKATTRAKKPSPYPAKLEVTLRVGNEFEGDTELWVYPADTISTLQAELDAVKAARKKYRYVEVVSVLPAKRG
ncbi:MULTISPECIES: hypothetical protein [Pseudomonas syringae group]|nr:MULTISPECIES: hypothetical protein [Pseudomonas syringae group]